VIDEALLETVRRGGPAILLERACWLVWSSERRSGVSAAMSDAQFVHFNAPVLAVQRNGRMEYVDAERGLGWTSNLAWLRANLEMMRPPAREDASEKDSSDENASGPGAAAG
jgi:hypothetical protein